jgi:hypothetical protein
MPPLRIVLEVLSLACTVPASSERRYIKGETYAMWRLVLIGFGVGMLGGFINALGFDLSQWFST